MPKIKNILIFVAIASVFVLIYIFFIKKSPDAGAPLVSTSGAPAVSTTATTTATNDANKKLAQEFLTLLLNVNKIELDDAIFSDIAFTSLHDSSIILTPDGTEGRPNPFAPLGTDVVTSGGVQ